MKLSNLILGLQILQKYYEGESEFGISFDGELFLEPTHVPVSDEDVKMLKQYGWRQMHLKAEDRYYPWREWVVLN